MILKTTNLTKRFGGIVAIDDVNISIDEGELRSIIGPNGAGKTTLFHLLTGLYSPTEGDITLNGESIVGMSPQKRVNRGLGRSFQITNIFPELSIRKNIRIAVQSNHGIGKNFWSQVEDMPELDAETIEIIDLVDIDADPDVQASTMSHGEKRRLEIGIAIALDPSILLLDEPTAGMSEEESLEVTDLIKTLNEERAVVLVEHDVDLVMELSDTITVLTQGSVIAEGAPSEVVANDDVQEAYLGGKI